LNAPPLVQAKDRHAMTSPDSLAAEAPAPILIQAGEPFAIKDMIGISGRPVELNIQMPDFEPSDYVLLSFRGLPDDFSMSSGFRTTKAWLVSAHEAKNLWLIPPRTYEGRFNIEVELIRGQSAATLTKTVMVELKPEVAPQSNMGSLSAQDVAGAVASQPAAKSAGGEISTPPTAESAARTDPRKEAELMALALSMLKQNDIAAARLIYARLAHQGSVRGALIMAETYDPSFLSKYDIRGLQPDMERAKYWYGVAAQLGSKDASSRLLALEGGTRR
jgi:hypothetical protein